MNGPCAILALLATLVIGACDMRDGSGCDRVYIDLPQARLAHDRAPPDLLSFLDERGLTVFEGPRNWRIIIGGAALRQDPSILGAIRARKDVVRAACVVSDQLG